MDCVAAIRGRKTERRMASKASQQIITNRAEIFFPPSPYYPSKQLRPSHPSLSLSLSLSPPLYLSATPGSQLFKSHSANSIVSGGTSRPDLSMPGTSRIRSLFSANRDGYTEHASRNRAQCETIQRAETRCRRSGMERKGQRRGQTRGGGGGGGEGRYIDYRDTERALSSSHGGRKLARRCIAVTSIRNSHLRIACPTCFVTGRDSACYPHGINVSRPLFPAACNSLPSPLSIGQPLSAISFSPVSIQIRSVRSTLFLSLCPSAG